MLSAIAAQAEIYLSFLAQQLPLTIFTFVGMVITEVVAIIPSPVIAIIAGTLSFEQNRSFMFLFVIGIFASLGKTFSSVVTYYIADKLEDVITKSRIGKILGVDEKEMEKYGRYLDGTRKDDVIMLLLRTIPIFPTLPISIIAGMIKYNIRDYIVITAIGFYIRFMFFLIIAYEGVRKYRGLLETLDRTESIIQVSFIFIIVGFIFFVIGKKWDRILAFVIHKNPQPEVHNSLQDTDETDQSTDPLKK